MKLLEKSFQPWKGSSCGRPQRRSLCLLALRENFLAVTIALLLFKRASAEDHVSVKWQDYSEDNNRIRVISKYLGIDKSVTENFRIKFHAVNDAITGATPSGSPDEDGSVPLSEMSDERESVVTDFEWTHGTGSTVFQYSRSKESDFLSIGYALTQVKEFNNRNTRLSLGVSYVDNEVFAAFMPMTELKDSTDLFVGLTQVIDPNTLFTVNLSHGESDGFLSDPYKTILQNTEIVPGLFLPLTYQENRPDNRSKDILYLNTKRYFNSLRASMDIGYRYFTDSWNVDSHTIDIEWHQKIGEKFRLSPKLRFYRQTAADFYTLDLSGANFIASDNPNGLAPHYSADYRLAKLETLTYGLKALYQIANRVTLDANFERYDMSGKDGRTPAEAFPDADVLTLGINIEF